MVDPSESYVVIQAGDESIIAGVSGSGAVETDPAEFLRGLFWIEDAALGEVALTDWMFFFDQPVEMDFDAGTFRVLPRYANRPGIEGQGKVNGTSHEFEVTIGSSAIGSISLASSTWSLHYEESSEAGSVGLHLEGTVHDPAR